MRIIDSILAEIDQESKTTRKFLEALPTDKMGYKPHEKSMPLGKLAMHVASLQGYMSDAAAQDEFNMTGGEPKNDEPTREQILEAFEKGLTRTKEVLGTFDDQKLMATWTFKMNGATLMSMPRIGMVRYFIMNHMYHHRGQLGVYLRLTGANVPSSYGPSADENPMAELMAAAAKA